MSLLTQTMQRRSAVQAQIDALIKTVEDDNDTRDADDKRDFTTEEQDTFRSAMEEIRTLDERITELRDAEDRASAAAEAQRKVGGARITAEPETYRRGGEASYFRDLYRVKQGDTEARDRLARNNREREVRAGVTTVAGAGGEFAPPLWQIDEFVALARPGRPVADIVTNKSLPPGVSSINLPKIATGTTVAAQGTQNTAVSNTDPTTTSVSASVATLAGYVLVSQQELDQSPINMDEVILADLAADYAMKLDSAVITAIVATSGINAVTYTDASPTSVKVNYQIADAIQRIHANRYAPPTHIAMTPRRWAGFLAYADTAGRPLVVPNPGYGAVNVNGIQSDIASQGVVGTLQGLPVVLDPNIPTNLGAGTNQDEVLVLRASDSWLFESAPHADAMPQTYGNQLSVLCRFYAYYAFTAARYAKSVSVISGTGMIPPALGS